MSRRITIDPITRLEGHGKIHIHYDARGEVERAYLQVPDFKGFEKFCEGRAAEEMPTLTQKICGVCPTAHHTASSKALDALFGAEPPAAAKKVRELLYNAFVFEDHLLHLFVLGGPDFLVGLEAPKDRRHFFGVLNELGAEIVGEVIGIRKRVRNIHARIGGSALYPVWGLPGGIAKAVSEEDRDAIQPVVGEAVEFAKFALGLFYDRVLNQKEYLDLLFHDAMRHRTYYMGLVDAEGKVNFYDGRLRVVDPKGNEAFQFDGGDYWKHLEERVDPVTYLKPIYLKGIGWKGYVDGEESGLYRVGPLARLNASEGMATPNAHAEFERMYDLVGGKPAHHTMAYHWARLIELVYAAERMAQLVEDEELTSPQVRNLCSPRAGEGVGVCEAPRGTLIHHYRGDEDGMITRANLLVATQHNGAPISMSVEKAARFFARGSGVSDKNLNLVEVAFRAYDPCLACATH